MSETSIAKKKKFKIIKYKTKVKNKKVEIIKVSNKSRWGSCSVWPKGCFHIAFPVFSLITSCVVFGLFEDFVYITKFKDLVSELPVDLNLNFFMANYGFLALTIGCNVYIFSGFVAKKRGNFLYWFIMKFAECAMLIWALIFFKTELNMPKWVICQGIMLGITLLEILLVAWKVQNIKIPIAVDDEHEEKEMDINMNPSKMISIADFE